MSRELLRQALDALRPGRDALYNEAQTYHQAMAGYRPNEHARLDAELASVDATIEAISAELAKPEPVTLTDDEIERAYNEAWRSLPSDFGHTSGDWFAAGARYAAALADPQRLQGTGE